MEAHVPLICECIAHLSSPGAYFSSRQRLAVSLEAAATFDGCGDCARLWDACLKPGSSVLALLRKSAMEPSVAGLPREVALCVRAITNLQSKLTIEFYNDLVLREREGAVNSGGAVSYTHLTLPTILLV